ncbi:MAG: hypothetical protein NVSMB65_11500 [Chloroflexota bacterium]
MLHYQQGRPCFSSRAGEYRINASGEHGTVNTGAKGSTILVVDDEPDILLLLDQHLQDDGYATLTAATGTEAIALARGQRPDLILLDVMMPGMSGFDVCNLLRDSPETRDIPVIFLTAVAETPKKVMGLRLGAEDYVTKPFDLRELSARVAVAVRRARSKEGAGQDRSTRS